MVLFSAIDKAKKDDEDFDDYYDYGCLADSNTSISFLQGYAAVCRGLFSLGLFKKDPYPANMVGKTSSWVRLSQYLAL